MYFNPQFTEHFFTGDPEWSLVIFSDFDPKTGILLTAPEVLKFAPCGHLVTLEKMRFIKLKPCYTFILSYSMRNRYSLITGVIALIKRIDSLNNTSIRHLIQSSLHMKL